ncbi:MAG: hypothetical protein QNJ81_02045 [Acidimicrobiia bacterium]|nr:hypothetical protein [Acidimicrobiia bacterium]
MYSKTRLAILALAVLVLPGSTPGSASAIAEKEPRAGTVGAKPMIRFVGGSEEDHALAEWAVARFAKAGLELPPMVVEFAGPALDRCGGAQATVRLAHDPVLVMVCWGPPFVMLHELAHVWEAQVVSEEQRRRFVRTRAGVVSWANPDDAWEAQGREHAANVIAWALTEDPMVIGRTYPNDRESLEAGFLILTGRHPLHDEGGEPIMFDRSAFDSAAAERAADLRSGIRSGR